jgi:hypothetical protein
MYVAYFRSFASHGIILWRSLSDSNEVHFANNHVKWFSCHHPSEQPHVADEGDDIRMWKVDIVQCILNKESWTADSGRSCRLRVGRGLTIPHRQNLTCYTGHLEDPLKETGSEFVDWMDLPRSGLMYFGFPRRRGLSWRAKRELIFFRTMFRVVIDINHEHYIKVTYIKTSVPKFNSYTWSLIISPTQIVEMWCNF